MAYDWALQRAELDINGYTCLGDQLPGTQVAYFRDDLLRRQQAHIEKCGGELLDQYGEREMLRNCGSFGQPYLDLIDSDWLNSFIDTVLNPQAILHGYHGILTSDKSHGTQSLPLRFHRDVPWFKDTRTCVLILMPLIDFDATVGPTELVPGTHLFENMPAGAFLQKHAVRMLMRAGQVFAMDGALWHRAGQNLSGRVRPLLQMNITVPFMKQQIDTWVDGTFDSASAHVKARLGYNVRAYKDPDEMLTNDRNWKSGNYDLTNCRLR